MYEEPARDNFFAFMRQVGDVRRRLSLSAESAYDLLSSKKGDKTVGGREFGKMMEIAGDFLNLYPSSVFITAWSVILSEDDITDLTETFDLFLNSYSDLYNRLDEIVLDYMGLSAIQRENVLRSLSDMEWSMRELYALMEDISQEL